MFAKKDAFQRLFLCLNGKRQTLKHQTAGILTLSLLLLAGPLVADTPVNRCPDLSTFGDDVETARVRYIYDGDTLQLQDGRKIRLIGINTPELARKNKTAEPFAREAKKALQALFDKNKNITLLHGVEQKDRYGRILAHGFLADGQNIQLALLARGLASSITVPPNTRFSACYLKQEQKARCNKAGLWQDSRVLSARKLSRQDIGFHLIKGKVTRITRNDKGIWLQLDDTLTVGIRPDNYALFDLDAIERLQQQSVHVRGWLNRSNKSTPYYLRLRHPASMQLSSEYNCS